MPFNRVRLTPKVAQYSIIDTIKVDVLIMDNIVGKYDWERLSVCVDFPHSLTDHKANVYSKGGHLYVA